MTRLNLDSSYEEFEALENEDFKEYVNPRPAQVKKTEAGRVTGAIRKLKLDKGYGFIAGDDGTDYFFIWAGMEKTTKNFRDLELLDRVSFVAIEGDKGPKAIMVRVI